MMLLGLFGIGALGLLVGGVLYLWTPPAVVRPYPASFQEGLQACSPTILTYCSASEGQRTYLEHCCKR